MIERRSMGCVCTTRGSGVCVRVRVCVCVYLSVCVNVDLFPMMM